MGTAAQLVRIHEEERVLGRDPSYRAYRARVRYRLIPFVY
jgi:protein-S-isoprenylcysteine O-methyltransferase Ste14